MPDVSTRATSTIPKNIISLFFILFLLFSYLKQRDREVGGAGKRAASQPTLPQFSLTIHTILGSIVTLCDITEDLGTGIAVPSRITREDAWRHSKPLLTLTVMLVLYAAIKHVYRGIIERKQDCLIVSQAEW